MHVSGFVRVEGRGLAGAAVSDGRRVVSTDADGRYELDAAGPHVWISVPDGHTTEAWYRPAAVDVDFDLTPAPQPAPVTFAQLTDLHLSTLPPPARQPIADSLSGLDAEGRTVNRPLTARADVLAVLDHLRAEAPDLAFAVATGDCTDRGVASEFAELNALVAEAPLPFHVLPGNHDHYGHGHEPEPGEEAVDSGGMGAGSVRRWERHVGPRWWSRTHAGLRLVALDWFSHRLGVDRDEQEAWLAADLATAPDGSPVLFLTHDQMPGSFFERVAAASPHVRIVGSLSGHWHTTRSVRIDGALHLNTANATFGGFDWTPASARLLTWDGERLAVRTLAHADRHHASPFRADPAGPVPADARWSIRLPGANHLGGPVLAGDTVLVTWSDDDTASGGVTAVDVDTGAVRWTGDAGGPVRGPVAVVDGVVVAAAVHGASTAFDLTTGDPRWIHQGGDPHLAWVYGGPVDLGDGAVAVGDVRWYGALEVADGSVRWARTDLAHPENYTTIGNGTMAGSLLIAGFAFAEPHTFAFDPATGETVWADDSPRFRSPAAGVVADPDTDDVYVVRLASRVDRRDATTGETRWTARFRSMFGAAEPVLLDDTIVVTTGLGTIHRLDRLTGDQRWQATIDAPTATRTGPYRRGGTATPAPVTVVGDRLVQPSADGSLHLLAAATGDAVGTIDVGAPLTSAAVTVDGGIVVADTTGGLHRLPL